MGWYVGQVTVCRRGGLVSGNAVVREGLSSEKDFLATGFEDGIC